MRILILTALLFASLLPQAATLHVGSIHTYRSIKSAIYDAQSGDSIVVHGGLYKEGNIYIDKSLFLLGENMPIIDGQKKVEVLTIKADSVTIKGFRIQYSGSFHTR